MLADSHLNMDLVPGEKSGRASVVTTAALLIRLGRGLPPGPVCIVALLVTFLADVIELATNNRPNTTTIKIGEVVCVYPNAFLRERWRAGDSGPPTVTTESIARLNPDFLPVYVVLLQLLPVHDKWLLECGSFEGGEGEENR